MQPVTQEELKELIQEAKKAKKDVSKLEAAMEETGKTRAAKPKAAGQKLEKKTKDGILVIESTGPARVEDFE